MTAYRGAGTEVALGSNDDPNTAVFTVIPQITNARVQESGGEIETTDLGSTRKTYIQDLPDSASINLTINYDPAQATHNETTGLVSMFQSGVVRTLRLKPNGATKYEIYRGFVMDNNRNFEPTAVQQLEVTFRATGDKTLVNV
jgi:hypothetical protein